MRALTAHQHRTAAALFALLALVYLWPVLVEGRLLVPSALLSALTPWRTGAAAAAANYINGELADVPSTYYPWNMLARELLHAGTFPAWNPYAYGGTPLFANAELAWLSPFSLPVWILPLDFGLGLSAAFKLLAAGFGTYLLVRELGLGFWPAMLAGVSFMLCAFNVVWLTYGVFLSVAALLPWSFWLVERIVRHGRSVDGLALAAVVACLLAGGHPGTQVHVLAATVLYALVRAVDTTGLERRERLRRLATAGAGIAVGGLTAAVVLLPAQQAAQDTYGALLRKHGGTLLPGTHAPWDTIRTALFPDWWGRPSEGFLTADSNYKERTYYAGAIPLLLAMLALLTPHGWRRKAPFVLLGVLGVLVAVRTPLLFPALIHLPLFDSIQNQRMLLWFLFAVAVLSAFGLQALLDAERTRRAWAVVAVALGAAALAIASIGVEGSSLRAVARYVGQRTNDATEATIALASVAWWSIFTIAFAVLLLVIVRRRWRGVAGMLVVLVVAFDLLHFAHGYNPMGPPSVVYPARPAAVSFLQRHVVDGRIAGVGEAMYSDWPTVYRLRDARGYDAPQPTLRFARLWQQLDPIGDATRIGALTAQSPKVLGLLGTRYVVTAPETEINASTEAPVPGLRPVYRGRDATILENERALPRAFVATGVRVAGYEGEELAAIADEGFDPLLEAVVRRDELGAVPVPQGGAGTARVVREENSRVVLQATLSGRGLVVLDDQWMPGWRVEVDGRPAPILQTDVVLRGVVVPAGAHEVVWSYRVPGLRLGAALSVLGLACALAWGAVLAVRARRRRPSF
ncbi:MAG TPA: hypothetical protein VGO48_15650 [Conexibacter sp.]|nr:hypothetical protein [Conexibacter sp.]